MYQGKHTNKAVSSNTPRRRRRLRWNKQFVMLVSVLALVFGMVGGSLAYLFTSTDPVQNTFTAATSGIDIPEVFDGEKKENVFVTNNSDFPAYVRATYTVYWLDADGNIDASVPSSAYTISINTTDWTELGGVYYYNKGAVAAAPDGQTSVFIISCEPSETAPVGYRLVVDVSAEVVQADPAQAVIDVWGVDAAVLVGATN